MKTLMVPDGRPSPLTPSAGDLMGVRSLGQPPLLAALSDSLILCWEAGPLPISLLELEGIQAWKGGSKLLLCGVLSKTGS